MLNSYVVEELIPNPERSVRYMALVNQHLGLVFSDPSLLVW